MDAYAVATIFESPQESGGNPDWSKIVQAAGMADLSIHAMLHFSWHVSINYHMPELADCMATFTQNCQVFEIQTAGLGVFTAVKPVLYLPIVKTVELAQLHGDLWERLAPVSSSMVMYYSPGNWVPHVTLNDENTDIERICRFERFLLFEPLSLKLRVDHMAVIFRNGSDEGIVEKFMFGGAR